LNTSSPRRERDGESDSGGLWRESRECKLGVCAAFGTCVSFRLVLWDPEGTGLLVELLKLFA